MVVELEQGIFKCERVGCKETVVAEKPDSKRSRQQAKRAAEAHEGRDAIHTTILDLSTLSPDPNIPNVLRTGFVLLLATTKGLELLSTKPLGREGIEAEASVFMQTLGHLDREKLEKRRLPKPGSITGMQQRRDTLRFTHRLLEPPILNR